MKHKKLEAVLVQTATLSNPHKDDRDLFDYTVGYDEEVGLRLASGLSPEEEKQAQQMYSIFNGLMGICVVFGAPGSGKDTFGNITQYKFKRFFPWKKMMRDRKPKPLFGPYAGLFNPEVLNEDIERMNEVASGAKSFVGKSNMITKAADNWVAEKGDVMLKNSVLYLEEYWKYHYKREPMNPMNKILGGINKEKRHLDLLIIGSAQQEEDLDRFTCLPFVDWRVTATKSAINPTGFVYYLEKVAYDRKAEKLVPTSKSFPMAYDAGKPRSYLGDGKIFIKSEKSWYRAETDDEELVLSCIKSGLNVYEDIVDVLGRDAGMSESEVLATLKELKFRKTKRIIDYPCFFSLFNSKNSPELSAKGLLSE